MTYGNTTGYIVPYQASVDITVNQNSEPHIVAQNLEIVNGISTFLWNNIPSGYQSVNQSTLYAVVSGCEIGNGGSSQSSCSSAGSVNNANIQPDTVGSQVSLFYDQNLQHELGTTCPSGNCLPSSGNPFPSTYMTSQPVYFGITLSSFGAYGCGIGLLSTCWPSIHLTLTVYTFLVGSYLQNSVNPNTITQQGLPGGNNQAGNPLNTLFKRLSNPLNLGTLLTMLVVIGIIVVLVVLGPTILSAYGILRRPRV